MDARDVIAALHAGARTSVFKKRPRARTDSRGHLMTLETGVGAGYAWTRTCLACGFVEAGDLAGHRFALDANYVPIVDGGAMLQATCAARRTQDAV